MVSLQKDGFMLAAPLNQEIDGSTGLRPAIDVITEENVDRSFGAERFQVSVDYGEHLLKQIGATMNVADRVETNSVRQPRLSSLGL